MNFKKLETEALLYIVLVLKFSAEFRVMHLSPAACKERNRNLLRTDTHPQGLGKEPPQLQSLSWQLREFHTKDAESSASPSPGDKHQVYYLE